MTSTQINAGGGSFARSVLRTLSAALIGAFACLALATATAKAEFGYTIFDAEVTANDAGDAYTQAGGHPTAAGTTIAFNSVADPIERGGLLPDGNARTVEVTLPAGFSGNPQAMPPCSRDDFEREEFGSCPTSSQVGFVRVDQAPSQQLPLTTAVYSLEPSPGAPATFGFNAFGVRVVGDAFVDPDNDYRVGVRFANINQGLRLFGNEFTLWGVPGAQANDDQRCQFPQPLPPFNCAGPVGNHFAGPNPYNGPPIPFFSLPTSCAAPGRGLVTDLVGSSWQNPTAEVSASFESHLPPGSKLGAPLPPESWGPPQGPTGCDKVPFAAKTVFTPTSTAAETATGLDVTIEVPQDGLLDPAGTATAHIKKTTVSLPQGVTLNPSSAEGLGVCSPADYQREAVDSGPGEGCPESSKVGTVRVDTPLLGEPLAGSLYLAQQNANPFNSLIALYIVARLPEQGIFVKLAGKVEPDERTGRIVTTFDDLPQLPFERFSLNFREGPRAPLVTPEKCGTYTTETEFVPWSAQDPDNPRSAEILRTQSTFTVTSGVNGAACPPGGAPSFKPGFSAGTLNNNAGSYSPLSMRLTRNDGEQNMTRFSALLPPGVTGKLAGVAECSEAGIAAARNKTGREELRDPSCPANSQVGRILVGAGVGSLLTWVPGNAYLAGPVGDAPLSVVVITPAVAGPFDVGTVVTREALKINPVTAEVEVDGALSDPIPHMLEGIPLKLRDLRVQVDRPEFTLNATNCSPMAVKATLFGSFADVFNPGDDAPVALQDRYQAADCAALGFKPKLAMRFFGKTHRSAHPKLQATLTMPKGGANIRRAVVTMPKTEFLENAHIRTICTRVQWAAKACPKAAIYGHAKAWTPLLDRPLQGPVYLRSSDNELPDLVADLDGQIEIDLVGRIDSVNERIRNTFLMVPDAPVSKFVLTMQGGRKGLLVNNTNLCKAKPRLNAKFTGQNGKVRKVKPRVKTDCGRKGGAKKRK